MSAATLFFCAVFAQGLVWSTLARKRLGILLPILMAYPIGLLLWVLSSVVILASPLRYGVVEMAVSWCLLLAAALGLQLRVGRLSAREGWAVVASIAAFALLASAASSYDLSVWSYDSVIIAAIGRSIAFHGEVLPDLAEGLPLATPASRGIFQSLVQGASFFLEAPFLYAAPPILAASFLPLFVGLASRWLRNAGAGPVVALALPLVALLGFVSTEAFAVHAFYVHENAAAGFYLMLGIACYGLAEQEGEVAWLPFAIGSFLALTLQRVETAAVSGLFLFLFHTGSRLPLRPRNLWLLAYAVSALVWPFQLLPFASPESFLTPGRLLAMMAGTVLTCIAAVQLASHGPAKLRQWIPRLVWVAAVLAPAAAALIDPAAFWKSVRTLGFNATTPAWGHLWWAILFLFLCLPFLARQALLSPTGVGLVAYLAMIFLLVVVHGSRISWADSGNRILFQSVPSLFFFFLVTLGAPRSRSRAGLPRDPKRPSEIDGLPA